MLDKWMDILGTLGVESPYSDEAPKSVTLTAEAGGTVTLNAPVRNALHPDPTPRRDLGYTNEITAQRDIDGVSHTLHINISTAPHVLAAEEGNLVAPRTTAQAMINLCLRGEIVQP